MKKQGMIIENNAIYVSRLFSGQRQYFPSLDLSLIAENKNLGKQSNHYFQTRFLVKIDIISVTEDEKIITENLQITEIFNNYFSNVIRSLCNRNIPTRPGIDCSQNTVSTVSSQHPLC